MKEKSTLKNSGSRSNWKLLRQKNDKAIDYRDIPPTSAQFWEDAEVIMPKPKVPVSIRMDQDVIEFFKHDGPGYQSRINAVLRAYINSRASQK